MIISKYYEKDGKMYVEASDYDKILYELKNSNENVAKIESELFDVQKSADEYYNKCIDLTKQVTELESELEVKDNLLKIKNGLLGNSDELPTDPMEAAQMLIDAKYVRKTNAIDRFRGYEGDTMEVDKYSINDLEQIAEHLLVYCKHHRGDEE